MSKILKEPTACIYNGYRLPTLDFLDEYPYVLIYKTNLYQYTLYCAPSPITIEVNDSGSYLLVREAPHCTKYYNQYDKTWRSTYEYTSQSRTTMSSLGTPIWSNHKIVYPNGNVYINAGNPPSPLYEGYTEEDNCDIDLYSCTIGLVFGLSDDLSLIENSMFENDNYTPPVVTPVSSLYLYGTPSTSGNIGLRVGESVTYYDGAVLPNVYGVYTPEQQDKYPHLVLRFAKGYTDSWNNVTKPDRYELTAAVPLQMDDLKYAFAKKEYQVGLGFTPVIRWECNSPSYGEWVYYQEVNASSVADLEDIMWTNDDIYYIDDHPDTSMAGMLAVAKSPDPIPVSGIVGYSYNGTVLPELSDEGYPYMLMQYIESNTADSTPIATMFLLDAPCVRKATVPFNCTMTGSYKVYKWAREQTTIDEWAGLLGLVEGMTANEWCFDRENSGENISFASGTSFTWANFDVMKTDGTVYLSGTDPIPVYE